MNLPTLPKPRVRRKGRAFAWRIWQAATEARSPVPMLRRTTEARASERYGKLYPWHKLAKGEDAHVERVAKAQAAMRHFKSGNLKSKIPSPPSTKNNHEHHHRGRR